MAVVDAVAHPPLPDIDQLQVIVPVAGHAHIRKYAQIVGTDVDRDICVVILYILPQVFLKS